jgi:uncharacterized protein (DUF427 family)
VHPRDGLELDGVLLAESSRPVLCSRHCCRPLLPAPGGRPRRANRDPDPRACVYKGQASYRAVVLPGRTVPGLAWAYPDPMHEALEVRGLVAFLDEKVDVIVDGQHRTRPVTPWS